jgi:hypothetical protein
MNEHDIHAKAVAAVMVITLVLLLGLVSGALASPWIDVSDGLLASYGVSGGEVAAISGGYPDGTFKPSQGITRAQFTKMADAAFGVSLANPATSTFSDVPATHYYYRYIEGAYAGGLVNGVGGGFFAPGSTITREQAIAIIVRKVAADQDFDLATLTGTQISTALAVFGDGASVSAGLRDEMAYAVMNGITEGTFTGNLAPQASVNRLVAATLLIRAGSIEPPAAPAVTALTPTGGPTTGGTSVTITGSNFTGATAVGFGGLAASSFTVVSDTQINVVSPAHTVGVVDVGVTTPNGTSANTAADDFAYSSKLTPAIITWPAASAITLGEALSVSMLTGGVASVPGTFGFTYPSVVPAVSGVYSTSVTFIPGDTINYGMVVGNVNVVVNKPTLPAPPTISSLAPTTGPTTGGTTVSITGANFTGATAVSFGGLAASFTVVSDTQINAVSPAHVAGAADIRVTTPNGTSANTAADDFTYSSSSIRAVQGQVMGSSRSGAGPLVGATVTVMIDAADPLYSTTQSNVVGTATTDAGGNYRVETASFRGAALPIGTIVDVSAVRDGYSGVTQYGVYDRMLVVCNFDYFADFSDDTGAVTPGAFSDRTLYSGTGIPPLPFEHLLPNCITPLG